jgi:hypothetical protein
MVDEAYIERIRFKTRNLPNIQTHTLPLRTPEHGTYYYEEEANLFRSRGPDGGFHTGYDQAGTYAGTQENAETTSIAMIAISTLYATSPFHFPAFPPIPLWIIYLYPGLAATAIAVVITVLVLEQRKRKTVR